uniref:Uncharacterized protein n=1 Tax=Physcomitrium patens TaxID=3218 RepID=A0A2K1L1R6_PHYPA|nr:hypothetical protein PHYPA_002760 [Physcomitrium patens]
MATSMLLQTYPCSEEQIPAPQPVRYRAPWWSAKVRGLVDMAMVCAREGPCLLGFELIAV